MESGENPLIQSLDGKWGFAWSRRPGDRPAGFYEEGFDDSGWGAIEVPGHMELQGYDRIHYINTMYPWEGHAEMRPPCIDWDYDPVGSYVKEFDLDAALMRKPDLILVDELAHTNAQGCRHKKRYQDVIELLDAGINVYTTVNVQHLESLHDIVASITHVRVYERIPDDIFDDAGQVELVDIAPEELRQRLEDGKIYHKDQADKASVRFLQWKTCLPCVK